MQIIDGKKISEEILDELAKEVVILKSERKKTPHLAAILIGDNPASEAYVRNKVRACEKTGFISSLIKKGSDIKEIELLEIISFLNHDNEIDGILVQLPLPSHINPQKIIHSIYPSKDVDGFHPVNIGRMVKNLSGFIPATPLGILILLEKYNIKTEGKHCVVLGRSDIVGLPVSILLARKNNPGNCTVSICHSKTHNLEDYCKQADIIIAALGQPEFVTADMVKEGAVIIDVGINRVKSESSKTGFKLTGDVKFNEVSSKCSYITPVPGGVGPMTIAALMKNTMKASRKELEYQ